ncbi:MAG TPA: TonB-dependent receptor [Terriglobales bacterium]|nr:TonB-dependent receptor [Terriglobales bacterium]
MKATLRLFCFALMFLLVRQSAFAQGAATGDVHVSVKDPKGNAVTNATVTVRDAAKGLERAGSSDGQGGYSVRQLAPGTYSVTVDASGFAKAEATGVAITVGGMAELPVSLTVAGAREIIEVSAQADIVETSRSSTTNTIGERRIDNLPINGRNYIQFTLTDSQVQRDSAPNLGAAPTSGLNMSGQRARSNLVNVDGADATDNSTNGVRSTVSQEAVQEFQIISNNYAAEYGRASGGVVNIITRSGSNDFHGDVYGYLRNRNFQAVNPFSTTSNPAYTRVQGGAAFGGPIKKDKTYYYFSYEVTRRHETGFSSIPDPSKDPAYFGLTGVDVSPIFGYPANSLPAILATSGPTGQAAFLASNPFPVPALQLYAFMVGASSGIALNGSYPSWFAGLPPSLVPVPVSAGGLQQFPSSCNPSFGVAAGFNFYCTGLPASFQTLQQQAGNFPVFEGTSLYSLRIDHNVSNSNRLTLRVNASPSTVTGIEVNGQDQAVGQNAYSRTSQQTYRDVAGVVQDTWTLGNSKVNEFRFQYARRGLNYFYNTKIPSGSDPAVNIAGYAYFGREPYSYIKRVEPRYQFTDNFSWSIGRHDTKFGGDFNYLPLTATFTVNYGGVYNFGNQSLFPAPFPQFNPVQSYGLGMPGAFIQGIGTPTDSFSNKPLGVFWQDSWRLRRNLTLNYGVRYDVEFPPTFKPPTGLGQTGYNFLGLQKGIQTDKNNIQPRFGIAWDPKGDGKTVVRASFGMFYDHPLLGLYFLGDASDGSDSGQLAFAGSGFCSSAGNPGNLNAWPIFQGNLINSLAPQCAPGPAGLVGLLGYQQTSANGNPNPQRFDPFLSNTLFLNQTYINAGFPLASQPFGYPQAKNFVYAYAQQANLTIERDLGDGFAFSLGYNFNGGRHLNRPINASAVRGDLLVANWQAAYSDPTSYATTGGPLGVGSGPAAQGFAPCGVNPSGVPWVSAALTNFFRPSGINASIANALIGAGAGQCVTAVLPLVMQYLQANGYSTAGFNTNCNPAPPYAGCVPFGDMDANYSNGSSIYHGLTANLRKRFSNHYEFLASYTWSHAIDDSTDLQSTTTPQDSYFPGLDRSNSTFDQRHRFVFSGVYQTGKLSGGGFASKLFSNWTFAPQIEFSSGRPFNIITGSGDNQQLSDQTGRPNTFETAACTEAGNPVIPSKFSPTGIFQEPCYQAFTPGPFPYPHVTLLGLDGNLGRNAGTAPWTVFNDLRIAKKIYFGERFNMDLIVDMFNLANVYNVAGVNPQMSVAGQATAAYDPRQFQFALKLNW